VKSVVPIVRFSFPILRSFKMENGYVKMNWPEYLNTRSQDLPPAFHDAGQFYFFKIADFIKDKKVFTDCTLGMEMPESEVQDIDNEEDWKVAEIKYTFLLEKNKN
jgi:pseudaminic acid cytidylyltransferase